MAGGYQYVKDRASMIIEVALDIGEKHGIPGVEAKHIRQKKLLVWKQIGRNSEAKKQVGIVG